MGNHLRKNVLFHSEFVALLKRVPLDGGQVGAALQFWTGLGFPSDLPFMPVTPIESTPLRDLAITAGSEDESRKYHVVFAGPESHPMVTARRVVDLLLLTESELTVAYVREALLRYRENT